MNHSISYCQFFQHTVTFQVEQILPPPRPVDGPILIEDDAANEGLMKIIRANIKRITEEVNKV